MELTKQYRVIKTHQLGLAYRIMKLWRMIVIFTIILAMPLSSWATVMMTSHCKAADNSPLSMTTQINDGESMHLHDQMPSPESNNQSNCDDNLSCSVSGCSITALVNGITIDPNYSNHTVYQRIQSLAEPSDPDLLFRPPISLS